MSPHQTRVSYAGFLMSADHAWVIRVTDTAAPSGYSGEQT